MVHSCCKDHCVTLVGLQCYSYYSTCCISRQFGEHQGGPDDEGVFHNIVFTDRILGRISEAWPRCRVTKDIVPPKYIYPIARYKQWLEDNIKWIMRDEKTYMKSSKKARRTKWPPWGAPCFTFLHFYDSHVFVFELNKGLKCSKSPMKTILLSFNFSNERISFYYLCLMSLLFIFFPYHVIFAHNVPLGILAMPMVFSLNFCLDRPFGFSI